MRVCVYCASSTRIAPEHLEMARHTGTWIGESRHTLVWGGCRIGLMQEVGDATRKAGGRVVAVLPRFLEERELAFESADEIVVTESLADRKRYMRENADVFVGLPGGVGTWDEVIEVLALKKLSRLDAPLILANVRGYFDPLLELFARSIAERFNPPDFTQLFDVVHDVEDLRRTLAAAQVAHATRA